MVVLGGNILVLMIIYNGVNNDIMVVEYLVFGIFFGNCMYDIGVYEFFKDMVVDVIGNYYFLC